MAELLTLARPYAKAAFGYAVDNSALESWSKILHVLSGLIQNDALSTYLHQSDRSADQQVNALIGLIGDFIGAQQQPIKNYLTILAENKRLDLLPEISTEFDQLKSKHLNQVNVTIETAYPLTAEQHQKLVGGLAKQYNSMVNATVVVNPDLIGGAIIRAGDQVLDNTAVKKLEQMRTRLLTS